MDGALVRNEGEMKLVFCLTLRKTIDLTLSQDNAIIYKQNSST